MEKVVMIGIMSVLLAIPLKKDKPEFSMLIILTACILISSLAVWRIRDLLRYLKTLQKYLGSGSIYIKVLFKMIAVTYMSLERTSAEMPDMGQWQDRLNFLVN